MAFLGLPLRRFLCWSLRIATIAICVWVIVSGAFGLFLEVLDLAAQFNKNFEISGSFKSKWRRHVWEGWTACNVVMVVCHLVMVVMSVLMILAVRRMPTWHEFTMTKAYEALLVMYIIADLGVACYKYSWYGWNTWRLPFLVFSFLFWFVSFLGKCIGVIVIYSRISEMDYEIKYGEKRPLEKYPSMMSTYPPTGGSSGYPPGPPSMYSYPPSALGRMTPYASRETGLQGTSVV